MNVRFAIWVVMLVSFTSLLSAQQPRGFQPQGQGSDGPWNHRVLLATSSDGLNWKLADESLAEQASVPELFVGPQGRAILLFVDASGRASRGALGVMEQQEGGSWLRKDTNLRGVDPNVVRLEDGTYRAYTKGRDGEFNAYSSEDGFLWLKLGECFRDDRYPNATDSDVFQTPAGWVMLVSIGPRLVRCSSADGLHFTADQVLDLGGSVSDTVKVQGGWRTFFHVNPRPETGNKMIIRSAFTADGKTWTAEGDRLQAPQEGPAKLGLGDPAPIQLKDGSWLMAVKSFMQSSTESAAPIRRSPGQPASPKSGGLQDHNVQSATSADGLTWTRDPGIRITGGSVPCILNDDDKRILVYFVKPPTEPGRPENVACSVSTDGVNFQLAGDFKIEGLSTLKAVDPSILKDADGKFRLYYLASDHRGDPARGENPHKINLALSDDGIHFREHGTVFEYDDLVDPDVFLYKGQYFMYVFGKGGTVIATSPDGLKFTYKQIMSPRDWGTTAAFTLPDGRLRLYAFQQRVSMGNAVGSFLSTDGLNWTAESGHRLKADEREQITDPFVIRWRGQYKMYFKTNPAKTPGHPGAAGIPGGRPPHEQRGQ